jgi:hypothetical protein
VDSVPHLDERFASLLYLKFVYTSGPFGQSS